MLTCSLTLSFSMWTLNLLNAFFTPTRQKDPSDAGVDNERENGNILNAMLKFPVHYTFHVVGRTAEDNSHGRDLLTAHVKEVVQTVTGNDDVICRTTPRGSKYIKVSVQTLVDNSAMISTIYDKLGALEEIIMHF
jgi:putative lipoic acid-binding regulatory protein